MQYETLHSLIFRQPFRPVEVTLVDGTRLSIRHPEWVALRESVCVVLSDPPGPYWFEPEHVVGVRHLRPGSRNGRRRA